MGGFDIRPVTGGVSLAAADQQAKIATTFGGSYSNAPGGTVTGAQIVLLEIPYSRWSADSAIQYGASDPDYVIGLSAQIGGSCLYRVNGVTGVQTAINPGSATSIVGPNAFTSYFSQHVAVLALVSGVAHLFTSINAGTTWIDRGAVPGAVYVRVRYKAKRVGQLFVAGGSNVWYSSNFGASLWPRTLPVASGVLGTEILG